MATHCKTCKCDAKPRSQEVRHAFYKALIAAGAQLCVTCRDYVNPETHDCAAYQDTERWETMHLEAATERRMLAIANSIAKHAQALA